MGNRSATVATPTPPGPIQVVKKWGQERSDEGELRFSRERRRDEPVDEKTPERNRRMKMAAKLSNKREDK